MGGADRAARRKEQHQKQRSKNRPSVRRAREKRKRQVLGAIGLLTAVGAVVAISVVLLGGSDNGPDPDVASSSITFVGDDFSFAPTRLTGLAGELEITLDNEGPGGHELQVLEQGVRISTLSHFDPDTSLGKIPWLAPGQSATKVFDLAPGEYQVVCLIPGHLEAGMQADLVVTP